MKKILFFAFLLCSFSAFAQYPAQPTTKQELGRQTTGDGLIYRGSGAPAYTPSNNRNAWIYYDTTNNRLYKSRLGSWSLMVQDTSAFNEIQMPYIVDDTIYLTQNVTGEPLTRYVNRVWPITNLSDTTSITGENQGDVAIVATGDTVAFRGSAYWNPFSGGGGGGSFNDFVLAADSGSPATITDGQTVTIAGGTGLTSVISGNTVTTSLDNTAITAATYGSATQVGQTTYDAQGRATGATNVSILLPISAVTLLPDSLAAKITRITSTNNYLPRWIGTSMGNSYLSQNTTGVVLDANLAYRITGGTTASRPTGAAGMMYWNTSNTWWDYHNGTAWFNPARSATTNGLFTAGAVLFGGADGTIQQDNAALFWDDTNDRLGVGTNAPAYKFDVVGGTSRFVQSGAGFTTTYATSVQSNSTVTWLEILNSAGANKGAFFGIRNNDFEMWNYQGGNIMLFTGATASSGTERLRITPGGLVGIGAVTSLSLLGVKGGVAIGSTYAGGTAAPTDGLIVQGNIGAGITNPAQKISAYEDDANNNSATEILRISHGTSGTPAAGIAARMGYQLEGASVFRVAGTTEVAYTNTTNAVEVADFVVRTMRAGTLTESLRSLGNGTLQIGTLSGTATQMVGATAGNILCPITPGYGLSLSGGGARVDTTALKAQFLPLTLTGTTEVNTAGQVLRIRDAGAYPDVYMNSNYWTAASDVNTFIDVGSTSGQMQLNSAGRTIIAAATNVELQAGVTGEARIDSDSLVLEGVYPVGTSTDSVLVRDGSTGRVNLRAQSDLEGVWLKTELENGNGMTAIALSDPGFEISDLAEFNILSANDIRLEGDNTIELTTNNLVLEGNFPVGASGDSVLVRDGSTGRVNLRAQSSFGSGTYLPLTLTGTTVVNTAGNQLTFYDAGDNYPYLAIAAADITFGSAAGTSIASTGADINIEAGATGGDINMYSANTLAIETETNISAISNSGNVSISTGGDGNITLDAYAGANGDVNIKAADVVRIQGDNEILITGDVKASSYVSMAYLVGSETAPTLSISNAGTGATVTGYSSENSAISGRFTFTTGTGAMAGGNVILVDMPTAGAYFLQVPIVQIQGDATKNTAGGLAAAVLIGSGKAVPIATTSDFTLYIDATGLANYAV